jgi:hypothetical protein
MTLNAYLEAFRQSYRAPRFVKLPEPPRTESPVPWLTSLYHNADAGAYGNRNYRGNCSGNLIRDLQRDRDRCDRGQALQVPAERFAPGRVAEEGDTPETDPVARPATTTTTTPDPEVPTAAGSAHEERLREMDRKLDRILNRIEGARHERRD